MGRLANQRTPPRTRLPFRKFGLRLTISAFIRFRKSFRGSFRSGNDFCDLCLSLGPVIHLFNIEGAFALQILQDMADPPCILFVIIRAGASCLTAVQVECHQNTTALPAPDPNLMREGMLNVASIV